MKTLLSYLTAALLVGAAVSPSVARADVDIDFFYDSLAPYGSWMDVGDYGYVWHPRVDEDWRPYSDGHWVYTDVGWTWVSDEPFGWAVYHYGRWAQVIGLGWIWVPDNEWGPAWVSWRHSPRYVGWAPLPPEARFIENIGFSNWVDSYYDIGPGRYRFVALNNFGARNLQSVYISRSQNYNLINQTTNITNISYVDNRVFNRGPDFETISRHVDRPIERLRLDRRQDFAGDPRSARADDFRTRQQGDALQIFAPHVGPRAIAAPRTVVEAPVRKIEVNHGWKGVGVPEEEAAHLRQKLKAEAKVPETLPTQPHFDRPVAGPKSPDATPGTAERRSGRPDATAPGVPGKPTVTDTPPTGRPGKGRPETTPGAPTVTDTPPTGRPGKGRPETTPGAPTVTDETPGRSGKGRPGGFPGKPATTDETPGRTKTPTGEPSPKVERPGVPERPSPKVERPAVPERPSPKVERPAVPERPSPKVERPSSPPAPETPKPAAERPAAPTRPTAPPTTNRGGTVPNGPGAPDPRKKKKD